MTKKKTPAVKPDDVAQFEKVVRPTVEAMLWALQAGLTDIANHQGDHLTIMQVKMVLEQCKKEFDAAIDNLKKK